MHKKRNTGFTLIELLAVIVILAIIMLVALPTVFDMISTAKYGTLKSEASTIEKVVSTKIVSDPDYNVNNITVSNINEELNIKRGNYDAIGVEKNNNNITVTLMKDNQFVSFSGDSSINNSKVYGLSWDGEDTFTRTDDAVSLTTVEVGVGSTVVVNDFDTAEIYSDIEEVIEDGNHFIKIPRFFIKKTVKGNTWTWQISRIPQDKDYYLPSCFIDETKGVIHPYVLIGKYNASLNGTKLESKPNKVPLVSKTIDNFRNYAKNTGNGYQLLDIHALDAIQTLFYIEFATLDSQSVMIGFISGLWYDASNTITNISGNTITLSSNVASRLRVGQTIDIETTSGGRQIARNLRIKSISGNNIEYETVVGSEMPGTIAIGQVVRNAPYLTGTTDDIVASSGSMVSNIEGKCAMNYRGIENLYGNIWQFIDGVNIQNHQAYISKKTEEYISDVFDGSYEKIGYTNATTDNYVERMGYDKNNPFIQIPISVTTLENSKYKDNYYQTTGNRVARFGGSWNYGYTAGISAWILSDNSSFASPRLGGRVLKTPL